MAQIASALDTKGLKRICLHCGARFYDMNKRPIICPSCGTEFTADMKPKGKRGTAKKAADPLKELKEAEAANTPAEETPADEEEEEEDDIVSLNDLDEDDDGATVDGDDEDPDLDALKDLGEDLDDLAEEDLDEEPQPIEDEEDEK